MTQKCEIWLKKKQASLYCLHIYQVQHVIIIKPGLHEPQLPVERSVTLLSSIVVERRRCALQVYNVARLQENNET